MTAAAIRVYTDGGCRPNPGPGGWGAVLELPDGVRELSGSEASSTNNRMELTAALRALEALPAGSRVELITDSTYLKEGISSWLATWRRNGWVTGGKQPVRNQDLWMALDEATRRHRVSWRWARGHAGEHGNERAHQLAAAAIPAPAAAARAAGTGPAAEQEEIVAFLAVAWSGKRRLGAWGALLRHGQHQRELAGRLAVASANAAHIASAALALEAIRRSLPTRVVTVSDYLRDGAAQWLASWRRRGWKTREGKPVANREWWLRLARQLERLPVVWEVAEQASAPPELERARELARRALAGPAAEGAGEGAGAGAVEGEGEG